MKFSVHSIRGATSGAGSGSADVRILSRLNDWGNIREHYGKRRLLHIKLLKLLKADRKDEFVELLLGVSDPNGNYSAAEHHLGHKILEENNYSAAVASLCRFANDVLNAKNALEVPGLIRKAGLKYFQIGVGSEASCMLVPEHCWVANIRTIWAHLVFKHNGNIAIANEELKLYRDGDPESEMFYSYWKGIHRDMRNNISSIAQEGAEIARECSVKPGSLKYLWADAIANGFYEKHHV